MERREAFPHFPPISLTKGLLEMAFFKYLHCLISPCHTPHRPANQPPTLTPPYTCTGCHTGISVGSSKISSRQRQKQRNASLALSSKTNSAALTDSWLAGCEGFQSVCFLVWSAYPMASMIHNVVRNTSYREKSSPPQVGRRELVRTAPKTQSERFSESVLKVEIRNIISYFLP